MVFLLPWKKKKYECVILYEHKILSRKQKKQKRCNLRKSVYFYCATDGIFIHPDGSQSL